MTESFDQPPEPTAPSVVGPRLRSGRLSPPPGVVPGVAAVECLLARTDEVAISIGPVWVYLTGLEFRIAVDCTDADTDLDPFGQGWPGRPSGTGDAASGRLLFGFRFSDASKVTTLREGVARAEDTDRQAPMLLHRSGSSYQGHWKQQYWLWPLPPPGLLEVFCEWPAAGIQLAVVKLDAAEIDRARSGSEAIFSEDQETSS
jgi:hypothetical protein